MEGSIWLARYPVRHAGVTFDARMTVVKMRSGGLWLHSPCPMTVPVEEELYELGPVQCIVAPAKYHYFYVMDAQRAFPGARTWVCPGIDYKHPEVRFDALLEDHPDPIWADEIDQILVDGPRFMSEAVFFHKKTKSLIVTDLIENIGDQTPHSGDRRLRFWLKGVFHMWNRPRPAPEYQLGWRDRAQVRERLERVLSWDFERIILSHGDTIERDAKQVAREAWAKPLAA